MEGSREMEVGRAEGGGSRKWDLQAFEEKITNIATHCS